MIDIYPDMFSFIELPLPEPRKVPDKSMADTDMEDFKGTREKFSWWWLYVIDETYLGMMHVVTACLKVYSMNFFTANYGKSISLEEFDSIQTNCTNNVSQRGNTFCSILLTFSTVVLFLGLFLFYHTFSLSVSLVHLCYLQWRCELHMMFISHASLTLTLNKVK